MAKRRRKSRKKNNPAVGCLVFIVCIGALFAGLLPSDDDDVSTNQESNTPSSQSITVDEDTRNTDNAPTVSPQPQHTATVDEDTRNTDNDPTVPPQPQHTATLEIFTLYTNNGDIRARSCPQANNTCSVIDVLAVNTSVEGIQEVEGSEVSGNSTWWEVIYNGHTLYIHASLLSHTPMQVQETVPIIQTQPAEVQATNIPRPRNCSTAVAMGLSPQQAAQWDHLDADHDGVACYGD